MDFVRNDCHYTSVLHSSTSIGGRGSSSDAITSSSMSSSMCSTNSCFSKSLSSRLESESEESEDDEDDEDDEDEVEVDESDDTASRMSDAIENHKVVRQCSFHIFQCS
jgi:hypothetical protein